MERDYYLWSGYYLYKYFVAAISLLFDKSVVSPTFHIATIGGVAIARALGCLQIVVGKLLGQLVVGGLVADGAHLGRSILSLLT